MKRKLNSTVNVGLLVAFMTCGVTGVLKMPELNIAFGVENYSILSFLHDWSGMIAVILAAMHVVLHARWYHGMTRNAMKRIRTKTAPAHAAKSVVAILAVLLFLRSNPAVWADRGGRFSNATVPQGIDYEAGSLKDGTYTGTANGYMPSLTVEVVVKNGVIGGIKIVRHNETMRWFNAVIKAIPDRILKSQSTDIDAVSGATCSSNGILSAVENALRQARK